MWGIFIPPVTDQRGAETAAFFLGHVLPGLSYTSIQMYVYVCDTPLMSFSTAWIVAVISPLVKKSAIVPLRIHSSIIGRGMRSPSSEYPAYNKSEVLVGHVTWFMRNTQQPFLITLLNSLKSQSIWFVFVVCCLPKSSGVSRFCTISRSLPSSCIPWHHCSRRFPCSFQDSCWEIFSLAGEGVCGGFLCLSEEQ